MFTGGFFRAGDDEDISMDESDLGNAGMMSSFMMPHPAIWQAQYRCFAASELQGKSQEILDLINYGGKVILPQSALTTLMNRTGSGPILFSIERYELDDEPIVTYTSVLEFVAEEGRIYIPGWMMKVLKISSGALITLKTVELIKGAFVKLQPQSLDFLEISDPKAVLERALRNFSCLHEGDIISIAYNSRVYDVLVVEAKPSTAISIFETDLEVDFDAPPGYVEPKRQTSHKSLAASLILSDTASKNPHENPFCGQGQRLNSRPVTTSVLPDAAAEKRDAIAIMPVRLPKNKLYYGHSHLKDLLREC